MKERIENIVRRRTRNIEWAIEVNIIPFTENSPIMLNTIFVLAHATYNGITVTQYTYFYEKDIFGEDPTESEVKYLVNDVLDQLKDRLFRS